MLNRARPLTKALDLLAVMKKNAGKKAAGVASSSGTSAAQTREEEKAVSVNSHGQIVLRIHAKPGAKVSAITNVDATEIGIAIAAPPREGQANEELLATVQRILGLRKSEVDFDKGAKSRSKVLLITTDRLNADEVLEKLKKSAGE